MSKIVAFRRCGAKERFRDQLEVACAILRNAIDSPVDEDLLDAVGDLANDLLKAIDAYRGGDFVRPGKLMNELKERMEMKWSYRVPTQEELRERERSELREKLLANCIEETGVRPEVDSPCLIWTGAIDAGGYGSMWWRGRHRGPGIIIINRGEGCGLSKNS
jgi:hypothetical protein